MATKLLGMGALARSIDKTTVNPGDAERAAIREMVESAKERGLDIAGPDGLLKLLAKTVLETASKKRSPTTSGTKSTTPLAVPAGTPGTAPGRRP